jgi:hypothetical protein
MKRRFSFMRNSIKTPMANRKVLASGGLDGWTGGCLIPANHPVMPDAGKLKIRRGHF